MPKPKGSKAANKDFSFEDPEKGIAEPVKKNYFEIMNISGDPIPLLSQREVDYYLDKVNKYQQEYKFSNVLDKQDLDRVLYHELMVFRWSQWQYMNGLDYDGEPVSNDIIKNIPIYSKEIRETKAALGVDKKTRESLKGGSTANFIHDVTLRGKQFGYHRNEQVIKAYTMWKELQGLVTLHLNATEAEQAEFDARASDVINWIVEKCAELDEMDEMFIRNHQRYWIRTELN